jgi:hypothetical protein
MSDVQNTENQIPPALDEDQVLAYTQNVRKNIVADLTKGKAFPENKGQQILLMQALDGMDRAALTSKRIKSDEKTSQGVAGAAGIIAQMLSQMGGMVHMPKPVDGEIVNVEPKMLTEEIPEPQLVPGEIEINAGQMDYNSFVTSMGVSSD